MQDAAPVSERLQAAVERAFAESEQPRVLEALRLIAAPEGERVRIAVLVLAMNEGACAAVVEAYAMAARIDWRDVLYWAEYHPHLIDYVATLRSLGL
jgi:hypothetical protein